MYGSSSIDVQSIIASSNHYGIGGTVELNTKKVFAAKKLKMVKNKQNITIVGDSSKMSEILKQK